MRINYASTEHMNAWLRHPVLGDPSFDTFERLCDAVHVSKPPYEWAVNGSLFCDFDGTWYYYAGLYPTGYACTEFGRFRTYCSTDKGKTWTDLGWGFALGEFTFEGDHMPSDVAPDVFVTYDPKLGKYLLTYDTATNDYAWETSHDPSLSRVEGGVAVALADSPAGPWTRMPRRIVDIRRAYGTCGRYGRWYASCVVPRKNDYIALCLADSGNHFAWALTAATAQTLDGDWTQPHVVLGCDRHGYYPCPMEFFPVEVHGEYVYARCTSVAANRNYQVVYRAPLEQAHDPEAWEMIEDGNVWHAHDHDDEYIGIWGQTLHGFVEDGRYIVMHASRNSQDMGTLGLAHRPVDQPYSDGFVLTGHIGPSLVPLKASYKDFSLTATFKSKGTVDFAFAYQGILGPDQSTSDAKPSAHTMSDYAALRVNGNECALISIDQSSIVTEHAKLVSEAKVTQIKIVRNARGEVSAWANGMLVAQNIALSDVAAPLAVATMTHSRLECAEFTVEGDPAPYVWQWNAQDALLGAGQIFPGYEVYSIDAQLAPDRWYRLENGFVGEGLVCAKWNLHGEQFTVQMQKAPNLGVAGVWVDGNFCGSISLCGEGVAAYQTPHLSQGGHAILVRPLSGRIAILGCLAEGNAVINA
ncbi:MAG: hypothetical protein IJW70_04185 [Clostridia bacterium]|nr:hypothetical protein [Clostridia bacterium]